MDHVIVLLSSCGLEAVTGWRVLFCAARDEERIQLVESYLKANHMFRDYTDPATDPCFSEVRHPSGPQWSTCCGTTRTQTLTPASQRYVTPVVPSGPHVVGLHGPRHWPLLLRGTSPQWSTCYGTSRTQTLTPASQRYVTPVVPSGPHVPRLHGPSHWPLLLRGMCCLL